jgi:hypothetical protein
VIYCYLVRMPQKICMQDANPCSGYNGNKEINAIARKPQSHRLDMPGPTVTGVIDNRNGPASRNPLSGFIIQDGCIPEPFNPVINMMLITQTIKSQALSIFASPISGTMEILASIKSFLLGPYAVGGALQRTSAYLIMSHDSNEITLTLKDGQICLRAPKEGRSRHFQWIKGLLKELFVLTGAKMGFSYFYGKISCYYHTRNANRTFRSKSRGNYCPSSRGSQYE